MSGFGGSGFGSGTGGEGTPPRAAFGSPHPPDPSPFNQFGGFYNPSGKQQPQPTFGSSVDYSGGGRFGTSTPSNNPASSFGGSGTLFGAPTGSTITHMAPFGSTNATALGATLFPTAYGSTSATGFGATTSRASPAFGNALSTAAFGNPAPATAFGSSSTLAAPIAFGSTPSTMFNSGGVAPGFGSAPRNTGFVSSLSTPTNTGFNEGSNMSFGIPAPAAHFAQSTFTPRGFASSSTSGALGFGTSTASLATPTPSALATPNPFVSSISSMGPAPPVSFGVSSNVAPTQGFANSNMTTQGFTSNIPFASSSTQGGTPFGASSNQTAFGTIFGGAQSDSEDMTDGGGIGGANVAARFGSTWPSTTKDVSLSPIPEGAGGINDSSMSPPMSPTPNNADEERLAQLKTKIEAKKKKLEDRRRRMEAVETFKAETKPEPPSLNPQAASFAPGARSLAERNAERFATKPKPTSASQLPDDLRYRRDEMRTQYKDDEPEEAQDIENAASLVGTCPYMCPDDELLRRQNENAIQLLERPEPGTIHPKDWTLRDTAVKRYQRSAADLKLDVPEWVRPPDVLERVCGYLEEWVMERDRQGPDPRFPQSESPPPVDVYRFVWDRTRMIRKDLILQNYVGTGGNCDARAVRCHERIARWHAMVEHQLSHIPDFVLNQSEQNIQEFGRTLKSLNQYYDDSMGRSTVDVPDEEGNETRTDLKGANHGCSSNHVMGTDPTDYDGAVLENAASSPDASKRLIGGNAVTSVGHGTSEPEMRALYILLTMNNDGGMEVLKYASHLFRNRPHIYNSEPVQLALRVFKAKKESNYARFFSILRDPSTPYLLSCIMFKYVEQMRKSAFSRMAKAYGARTKEPGNTIQDAYPLKRLVRLLNFEDMDEARMTCSHFNISVKVVEVSSTSSPTGKTPMEIVFWKMSDFRVPKDPAKGFELRLRPRKMIQTIESKLKGATRLVVCRGEVSGAGATLSSLPGRISEWVTPNQPSSEDANPRRPEENAARQKRQEDERRVMEELTAKRKLEEKRRMQIEQKEKDEEASRQEEIRRKEKEVVERIAEMEKVRAEKEERRLQVEETNRQLAEKAAREERMQREEEERRLAAEHESARKRAEADVRKRLFLEEELRKKREEEEREEKHRRELEKMKRAEEERWRIQELKLHQERLIQERKRREEEARKIAEARCAEVDRARKFVVWRRLLDRNARELQRERTRRSLGRIDSSFSSESLLGLGLETEAHATSRDTSTDDIDPYSSLLPGMHALDVLSRQSNSFISLAAMLRKAIFSSRKRKSISGRVVLAKLVVVVPTFTGPKAERMKALLQIWLDRRLRYNEVVLDHSEEGGDSFEVRTVVSSRISETADYDMVLFVVPPFFGERNVASYAKVCFPQCNDKVQQAVLCLDNGANLSYRDLVTKLLSSLTNAEAFHVGERMEPGTLENALEESCGALLESFAVARLEGEARGDLIRKPIFQLGINCIRAALWRGHLPPGANEDVLVLNRAREALMALLAELESLSLRFEDDSWWNWPASEFANGFRVVEDYFGKGIHLPIDWRDTLLISRVRPSVMSLYAGLDGDLNDVCMRHTRQAPGYVRLDCEEMLWKRQFRRCLELALTWRVAEHNICVDAVVILPVGWVHDVVEGCVRRMSLATVEESVDEDVKTALEILEREDETEEQMSEKENVVSSIVDEELDWTKEERAKSLPDETSQSQTNPQRTPESFARSPEGVNTPMTPQGVNTPNSWPQSSQGSNFLKRSKRGLDVRSTDDAVTPCAKRSRDGRYSKSRQDSMDYTKKLEALVKGESTYDVSVGNVMLSQLLRDAPDIEIPSLLQASLPR